MAIFIELYFLSIGLHVKNAILYDKKRRFLPHCGKINVSREFKVLLALGEDVTIWHALAECDHSLTKNTDVAIINYMLSCYKLLRH